ncbi:response regulator transcription factor [Fodinicurvata sp. EGI_FJ10296]|uniref:response regulator transcription factor n=1 Tax=Fodinicurvata sp. EGI_FJ10296 TaxID=3231908 RepID=UPI003454074D
MSTHLEVERALSWTDVVVVDQSRLCREGMKRLLESTPFRIVNEGRHLGAMMPDLRLAAHARRLLLVEWFDDDPALLEAVAELAAMENSYRVIALSPQMNSDSLVAALRAGVRAFLLRDLSADALVQSMRLVQIGEVVFPTELAATLIGGGGDAWQSGPGVSMLPVALTEREMMVLRCLVSGESNKAIARRLEVTEGTIKMQLKSLLRKINAGNRTQAAIWAQAHGLAAQPDDDSPDYGSQQPQIRLA